MTIENKQRKATRSTSPRLPSTKLGEHRRALSRRRGLLGKEFLPFLPFSFGRRLPAGCSSDGSRQDVEKRPAGRGMRWKWSMPRNIMLR